MNSEPQFPPYDATELTNILETRAEVAIADDAMEDGVLRLCSALAARDSGSARQALDLLRLAGEVAKTEDADNLREEHVNNARRKLEQGFVPLRRFRSTIYAAPPPFYLRHVPQRCWAIRAADLTRGKWQLRFSQVRVEQLSYG